MLEQVLLGFDYGLKYIGVAIGQTLTRTARPLKSISARQGIPDWDALDKLIATWKPNALVVGIPIRMDGSEQPLTHRATEFTEQLRAHYQIPVYHVDERLSTVEARSRLFEQGGYKALTKDAIDSTSAQLILENWLRDH